MAGWLRGSEVVDLPGAGGALAIDHPFPVVAMAGLGKPRLLVARRVLASCDPQELAAIVAHERAHERAHDNLKGWLLQCAPDVLAWMPEGRLVERAWRQAAELEADAAAASATSREDVAAAIVKVARLALGVPPLRVALPGFHEGGCVAERVERLLGTAPSDAVPDRRAWLAWGAAAVASTPLAPTPWLQSLHQAIETLVHL